MKSKKVRTSMNLTFLLCDQERKIDPNPTQTTKSDKYDEKYKTYIHLRISIYLFVEYITCAAGGIVVRPGRTFCYIFATFCYICLHLIIWETSTWCLLKGARSLRHPKLRIMVPHSKLCPPTHTHTRKRKQDENTYIHIYIYVYMSI